MIVLQSEFGEVCVWGCVWASAEEIGISRQWSIALAEAVERYVVAKEQ